MPGSRDVKTCTSRESNPGHVGANDVFYHKTTDARADSELQPFQRQRHAARRVWQGEAQPLPGQLGSPLPSWPTAPMGCRGDTFARFWQQGGPAHCRRRAVSGPRAHTATAPPTPRPDSAVPTTSRRREESLAGRLETLQRLVGAPWPRRWSEPFADQDSLAPSCRCIGRGSNPGHIDGNDVLYH